MISHAQWMRRVAVSVWVGTLLPAHAADLFVSIDPQGAPHYSTQRLDNSSVLIAQETDTMRSVATAAPEGIQTIIDRAAARYGLSPNLLEAVAGVESNFNPRAVSRTGALGTMQLMPQTAARFGVTPIQLLDAERNVDAGARHLRDLLARYHGNTVLALAAYNAGEGAVARHGHRVPPYGETMLYVATVLAKSASGVSR